MSNDRKVDARKWGRPPITEVPMDRTHYTWREPVPGGWREDVSKVALGACSKCALYWRMWEDEPRPCPGCSASDELRTTKEALDVVVRELALACAVVDAARPRQATIGSGARPGELLEALSAYDLRALRGGS